MLKFFEHFHHAPGFQTLEEKERENKGRDSDSAPCPAQVIFLNLEDYAVHFIHAFTTHVDSFVFLSAGTSRLFL